MGSKRAKLVVKQDKAKRHSGPSRGYPVLQRDERRACFSPKGHFLVTIGNASCASLRARSNLKSKVGHAIFDPRLI